MTGSRGENIARSRRIGEEAAIVLPVRDGHEQVARFALSGPCGIGPQVAEHLDEDARAAA